MAYVIRATARSPDGSNEHGVQTRWRSDDPWGALQWCLFDALIGFIPDKPDLSKVSQLALVSVEVAFEPDAEDANAPLFKTGFATFKVPARGRKRKESQDDKKDRK